MERRMKSDSLHVEDMMSNMKLSEELETPSLEKSVDLKIETGTTSIDEKLASLKIR